MPMKSRYLLFIFLAHSQFLISQEAPRAEIYLLTCGPGTEIYSVYGHSALRIVIPYKGTDLVYNWGVFDFDTPNFGWKFANGRLNYMLGVYPYDRFLRDYFQEQRWVLAQKLNIEDEETEKLFSLIADNLKPENIEYRYDFLYDDCSTRIRDLIEKAVGENLLYPPERPAKELKTFRFLTGEYEKGYPWTKLGIDLLLGSPNDKKATFRNRMFLPIDLKNGLSELLIRRNGKMIPLLTDPLTVVDFESPVLKENLFTAPPFVFSAILILLIIFTGLVRKKTANTILDILLFFIFSILSILMIFFNFFSEHNQLKWNLNIIWLNPFILVCLVSLLSGRNWMSWFRLVFFLSALFLALLIILPQQINNAFVPVIIILILRSSVRAGFEWNPLTLPYLT
jgi:hypothetical protein